MTKKGLRDGKGSKGRSTIISNERRLGLSQKYWDALPWKSVDMTNENLGQFDDSVFYGLEEIDGNHFLNHKSSLTTSSGTVAEDTKALKKDKKKKNKREREQPTTTEAVVDVDTPADVEVEETTTKSGKKQKKDKKQKEQQEVGGNTEEASIREDEKPQQNNKKQKKQKENKKQNQNEEKDVNDTNKTETDKKSDNNDKKNKQQQSKGEKDSDKPLSKKQKAKAAQTEAQRQQKALAAQPIDEKAIAQELSQVGEWGGITVSTTLQQALEALDFTTPTPIQKQALPAVSAGKCDIVGVAETGSGKTLVSSHTVYLLL